MGLRGFQLVGFGKGFYPTQGPGFMGIFVSAWQRHGDTDTRSFQFSFFNSFFHTYMGLFSKQGHATKVFMQIAPPLLLPSLGFSRFSKLIQPLLIRHGGPTRGAAGPIERWPGRGSVNLFPTSVQTVFFRKGDGAFPLSLTHRLRDGCACSRGRDSRPRSH